MSVDYQNDRPEILHRSHFPPMEDVKVYPSGLRIFLRYVTSFDALYECYRPYIVGVKYSREYMMVMRNIRKSGLFNMDRLQIKYNPSQKCYEWIYYHPNNNCKKRELIWYGLEGQTVVKLKNIK